VKRLLSLVSRRNAIVHIKPKTHLMPIPLTEEDLSRPIVSDELLDLLRGPSMDELRLYRDAIEQFELQFVNQIVLGDYKCGDILIECRYSPGKGATPENE
jgi:hypothetical protein